MVTYDAIIVGSGIAGLTSGAYLARANKKILICEQAEKVGGLVNSFTQDGFLFDGGIRAMENSGIVFPMLRQLDIPIEFHKSPVSIRVRDQVIRLTGKESLDEYGKMLGKLFPENLSDIAAIVEEIRKVMGYMDVLYGIDNPYFLDVKKDRKYFLKEVIPWLFRYGRNIRQATKLKDPIQNHLRRFTRNQALIDVIAQHFFRGTPAFFALSYFSLYLDYYYPRGGMGTLADVLVRDILAHGGEVATRTEVVTVDPQNRNIETSDGKRYSYGSLIWAADSKSLYRSLRPEPSQSEFIKSEFTDQKQRVEKSNPGDSVHSLFVSVDLPADQIGKIVGAHMFFTPSLIGLSASPLSLIQTPDGNFTDSQSDLQRWMLTYLENTTYEISIPAMRYSELAPQGKTGIIVSTLVDYSLVSHIARHQWYEDYKRFCENHIIEILDRTLIPGLKAKIIDVISATPLSIEKWTKNAGGAITGWSFTDSKRPVLDGFQKIAKAVNTPIPGILQAGQWSFSPSGLPVSILTGKLAADHIIKRK
ncbi:MAG TPA: NAD(P)/FAD-dependent oxidoreductase [Candidatus Izemoplasmatales bacterium]|nr:NAD(P)/FAD-dependent oxidoreductase [Candidatus Izemoplasmatales bacterium]